MSDAIPKILDVPLQSLIELAVEHWRLARSIEGKSASELAAARHAIRRIGDFLKQCELEVRSLEGMISDGGLAARVIDVADDPTLPDGTAIVDETLSPLILWRGKGSKQAEGAT